MKQIILLLLAVILFSCGKGTLDNAENAFGRYVATSDSIVYAGHANVGSILKKSDYKSEEKIQKMLDEVLVNIEKAVDVNQKVYFALKGSLDQDIQATVFFNLKDAKEFSSFLKKNGNAVNSDKQSKLNFVAKNDQFIFYTDKYCVMHFGRKVGGYVAADVLAFDKMLKDASKSSNELVDLSKVDGDIVLVSDMYQSVVNQKDFSEVMDAKQAAKLADFYKDCFTQMIVSSEKGYLDVTTKINGNKEFKKYFAEGSGSADVTKLGTGNAVAGLALNMDSKKLSEFINAFMPGVLDKFLESSSKAIAAAYALGDKDLSKFVNGNIAVTVTGDFKKADEGVMPEFNGYVGYGSMGGNFNGVLQDELTKKGMKTVVLNDKFAKFSTKENSFAGNTIYPSYVKNFGKDAFTLFIDVQGLGLENMGEMMAELNAVKYIYASGDFNKSNFRIYMRDNKTNFLKTALLTGIKMFEAQMSAYSDYDEDYDDYEYEDYDDEY